MHSADRTVDRAAVVERLDRVHDPELDRSIVDLEYVDAIRIGRSDAEDSGTGGAQRDGTRVEVDFVLPTAWCSPAFAWMMATGIRDEVGALAAVTDVRVELLDHMHDEEINHGVDEGLPFEEVFDDAEDGIEEVRAKLDHKARLARQYDAAERLLDAGLDPEQIVSLTRDDLDLLDDQVVVYLRDGTVAVTVPATPITEYLEKARAVGVVTAPEDRLFLDFDGEPIPPEEFEALHRETRLAKSNMSGQAGLCAQLHEARNGVEAGGD